MPTPLPLTNTDSITGQDRQAIGNQPDNTPATGGQTVGGGGGGGGGIPLTTLGDTLSEDASPAPVRIPGNTTTRRQYYAQRGTGSVSALPDWTNGPSYNVQDFGIIPAGSGGADLTANINALIVLVPAGSTIYVPTGSYRVDGPVTSSKQINIRGDGVRGTEWVGTSTTAAILALNPAADFCVQDIAFRTTATRTAGDPVVKLDGAGTAFVSNVVINCKGDGLAMGTLAVINFLTMVNVQVFCQATSGVALLIGSVGGSISNCLFYTANNKPAGHITGGLTSLQIVNCGFFGGGALFAYTPSAITSNGTTITVSLAATAGFKLGGYIVLKGMTSTAYNGFWRITAVTLNTSVACVATPFFTIPGSGTGTVGASGIAETCPACLQIDNSGGAINESMVSHCGFYASVYPDDPVSAAILVDGTQSISILEGWQFDGNYYDYGKVQVWIWGGGSNGSTVTACRISITGGQWAGNGNGNPGLGLVWASKAPSITISNVGGNANPLATSPASSYIYLYSDSSILCDNFRITASDLCQAFFNGFTQNAAYALTIDGGSASPLTAITVSGCTLWGQTAPTRILNSGITTATNVSGGGNQLFSGSGATPAVAFAPYFSVLNGPVVSLIKLTSNQTFGTGSINEVAISYSSAEYDPSGVWSSGSPTVLSVPTGTRRMRIIANARWTANVTGSRCLRIKDNSTNNRGDDSKGCCAIAGVPTGHALPSPELDVATLGITSFTVSAIQDSGGVLDMIGNANFPTCVTVMITA